MFLDYLALLYNLGDTEVANFYAFLTIQEDVIELVVTMNHRPAVDVCQPICDLLEYKLCI